MDVVLVRRLCLFIRDHGDHGWFSYVDTDEEVYQLDPAMQFQFNADFLKGRAELIDLDWSKGEWRTFVYESPVLDAEDADREYEVT